MQSCPHLLWPWSLVYFSRQDLEVKRVHPNPPEGQLPQGWAKDHRPRVRRKWDEEERRERCFCAPSPSPF